jgi:hypothetical protein
MAPKAQATKGEKNGTKRLLHSKGSHKIERKL